MARRRILINRNGGSRRVYRRTTKSPKRNRNLLTGLGNALSLQWLFGRNRVYRRK